MTIIIYIITITIITFIIISINIIIIFWETIILSTEIQHYSGRLRGIRGGFTKQKLFLPRTKSSSENTNNSENNVLQDVSWLPNSTYLHLDKHKRHLCYNRAIFYQDVYDIWGLKPLWKHQIYFFLCQYFDKPASAIALCGSRNSSVTVNTNTTFLAKNWPENPIIYAKPLMAI